jgi:hypothetical protein
MFLTNFFKKLEKLELSPKAGANSTVPSKHFFYNYV